MHRGIARPLGKRDADAGAGGIAGLVYSSVRGVTRGAGFGIDAALKLLRRPRDVPMCAGRDSILSIVNGVMGDYLRSDNPPAIDMEWRVGGGHGAGGRMQSGVPSPTSWQVADHGARPLHERSALATQHAMATRTTTAPRCSTTWIHRQSTFATTPACILRPMVVSFTGARRPGRRLAGPGRVDHDRRSQHGRLAHAACHCWRGTAPLGAPICARSFSSAHVHTGPAGARRSLDRDGARLHPTPRHSHALASCVQRGYHRPALRQRSR